MNPLGRNMGIPPQFQQNIQQIKNIMRMAQGNPNAILQQNPMFNQVLQMTKGQDPKDVFYSMARAKGIDPDAFLRELQK